MLYKEFISDLEDRFITVKRKYERFYSLGVFTYFLLIFLLTMWLQKGGVQLPDNYAVKGGLALLVALGLIAHFVIKKRFVRTNRFYSAFLLKGIAEMEGRREDEGEHYNGIGEALNELLEERGISEENLPKNLYFYNLSLVLKRREAGQLSK